MTTPDTKQVNCPFCSPGQETVWISNDHAVALRDSFPISNGHTLVIPRLHAPTMFDLPEGVQRSLWLLVAVVRSKLVDELHPDGFNIGVNDGEVAGQTVPHAHIHVIPRYKGDVDDPRGGVRWVIPAKAKYWK